MNTKDDPTLKERMMVDLLFKDKFVVLDEKEKTATIDDRHLPLKEKYGDQAAEFYDVLMRLSDGLAKIGYKVKHLEKEYKEAVRDMISVNQDQEGWVESNMKPSEVVKYLK